MADSIETAKDFGDKPADVVTRWLREIKLADKHEDKWRDRAQKIIDLYRDEKDRADDGGERFNILYANTEVLKGALYSRVPTPDVRRRFLDKDPVGKIGAQVLQRALSYSLDAYDFHGLMHDVVEDMVLPGRGVARVKYKAHVKDDALAYEEVVCDYVEWDMFRYSPAKRWEKVRWVAFGELLTRDDLVSQFGEQIGPKVALKWMPKGVEDNEENQIFKRALVWTIWNKPDRTVYVVTDGYTDGVLKKESDPLKLEGFFPTPRPIYDISTTGSLVPVPEYTIYQDQAMQLEELHERIAHLTDALRRRGVYDASVPRLEELAKGGDNFFVPLEDWTKFSEKGGLEAAFQELPIENLAKVLVQLMEQEQARKAAIYELIGLSDIMRGTTKSSETLGAQQLKSQYGEIRIGPRQGEVQRYARDLLRLKGEIIAEHFSPETLAIMTGLQLLPTEAERQQLTMDMRPSPGNPQPQPPAGIDPAMVKRPSWEAVMKVLKSDKLRGFRIDIETDSTIKPQADEEQKNRTELITAVTGFLEKAVPAVQVGAIPHKVAAELLQFGVRAFRVGPQLEEVLDEWTEQGQEQSGPTPADMSAKMAELQQREEALTAAEQEFQKRGQQVKDAEARAKDVSHTAALERVTLDKDREVFMAKEQFAKMQAHMKEQLQALIDEQKQSIEAQATGAEEKGSAMVELVANAMAQLSQALAGINDAITAQQQQTNELISQIAGIQSRERVVKVTRQRDGSLQGSVTLQ